MKLFKILYLYILGYVDIRVSGFFTERFVNLCFAKSIFLWKLNRVSSGEIEARISCKDFRKIRKIAKASKCKVQISSKKGMPFLLHRYKRRKIFAITFAVVAILVFGLTRFVWNIEINCNGEIDKNQILNILSKNGIEEGKLISKINTGKAINDICMTESKISWCGIKVEGTNVIVSLEMATLKEEVLDENTPCNVVAAKDGIIIKITARNGTAVVKEDDLVKQGDILISSLIEGKYTEPRNVAANRRCFGKSLGDWRRGRKGKTRIL